jgi:hypothetical protein
MEHSLDKLVLKLLLSMLELQVLVQDQLLLLVQLLLLLVCLVARRATFANSLLEKVELTTENYRRKYTKFISDYVTKY